MLTEAERTFDHGFVLAEQDLRRLVDDTIQQIKRVTHETTPIVEFEIRFRNGALAKTSSLDEVLATENAGSSLVTRLSFEARDRAEDPIHNVSIRFANVEHVQPPAIQYSVRSDDRDWAFITSSQIEERIAKVKRVAFHALGRHPMFVAAPILVLMVSMLALFFTDRPAMSDTGAALERQWRSKHITDPIEALIFLEKQRNTQSTFRWNWWIVTLSLAAYMLVGMFPAIMDYLSPPYTFKWGDYADVYQRRDAIKRYLLVAVITGVVVSIIAAVIVSRLNLA